MRSNCIEKVLKWFDEIGMLPRPELRESGLSCPILPLIMNIGIFR